MKKTNRMNKITAVVLAAMITAAVASGCSSTGSQSAGSAFDNDTGSNITSEISSTEPETNTLSQDGEETPDSLQNSVKDTSSKTEASIPKAEDMFSSRDLSGDYDENSAVTVTCSDSSFTVKGDGASVKDNVLTISKEGVYILSGTVKNGRIVVDADDNAKVQIVLNNCSVTCSDYSALYVKNADKVFVTLAKDTKNTIADGKTYKADSEQSNVDAAVFSKCDLTFNGSGSLTVTGNMNHGIVSKDDLKITGGTLKVTAVGSGISGKDSVRIADGTVDVTSGGDGIKSSNEDEGKGFVYIGGGKITVNGGGDGIQAESVITCDNGEIKLTTGGGSENSSKTHTEDFGNMGGRGRMNGFGDSGNNGGMSGFGGGNNGGANGFGNGGMSGSSGFEVTAASTAADSSSASDSESSDSAKGLKAAGDIIINDGKITIDSADDSVHSNANVTISGGTVKVSSGDDGIHADTALVINGGSISVTKSYEGLEGSNITVNGGDVDVTASDDGMNAGGGDGSSMGGRPGQNSFTADSDVFLRITGGEIKVNAGGDGLDSNNTLSIEGGTIYVDGPTNNGNAAVDYETTATISGGTLVAAGSSGMAEAFSADSKQASILYCMSESHNAGEKITLTSESGEEIVSYTAAKTFNAVNISSPKLTSSGKYTLKVGDKSYDIEMTSNSYSNGGMSGGMGGKMFGQNGEMDGGMMFGQNGEMDGGMMFGQNGEMDGKMMFGQSGEMQN